MIKIKEKHLLWMTIVLSAICLTSCSTGQLYIEKKGLYEDEVPNIKKIVSIDPQYELIDQREEAQERYLSAASREDNFNNILLGNAKKNKLDLQIVDSDALKSEDLTFFNDLMPLRRQMWNANLFQDVDMYRDGTFENYKPPTAKFERSPIFDSRFSRLSEVYGTPYFAMHGVLSSVAKRRGLEKLNPRPKYRMLYYCILVNVVSSEVIYREVRTMDGEAGPGNLNFIAYDSFRIIRKAN